MGKLHRRAQALRGANRGCGRRDDAAAFEVIHLATGWSGSLGGAGGRHRRHQAICHSLHLLVEPGGRQHALQQLQPVGIDGRQASGQAVRRRLYTIGRHAQQHGQELQFDGQRLQIDRDVLQIGFNHGLQRRKAINRRELIEHAPHVAHQTLRLVALRLRQRQGFHRERVAGRRLGPQSQFQHPALRVAIRSHGHDERRPGAGPRKDRGAIIQSRHVQQHPIDRAAEHPGVIAKRLAQFEEEPVNAFGHIRDFDL